MRSGLDFSLFDTHLLKFESFIPYSGKIVLFPPFPHDLLYA